MPRRKDKKWIQKAIKKPGALRAYVKRRFGEEGFTKGGTIKMSVLRELAKRNDTIGRRARLAMTLRGMRE
jgi:hypothetical protein